MGKLFLNTRGVTGCPVQGADGPVEGAKGTAGQLIVTVAAQRCLVRSWTACMPTGAWPGRVHQSPLSLLFYR